MSTALLRPTSIDGIKRLAKSIGRARGVRHTLALDLAAQQAGFENFRHASNTLCAASGRDLSTSSRPGSTVFVTSYWRDYDTAQEGRETMTLSLARPLDDVVGKGRFFGFRMDAGDHLEEVEDAFSQEYAQKHVLHVLRCLQFADATGLHPYRRSVYPSSYRWGQELPMRDHPSLWVDPETGAEVLVDEPYRDADMLLPVRRAWASDRDILVEAPAWGGMYLPPWSTQFLATERAHAAVLARAVKALGAATDPVITWSGESAPYAPVFSSPARLATGKRKRSRPKPPAWRAAGAQGLP